MRHNWDPAYYGFSSSRRSAPPGADMRASDGERNEVADKLSRHFSEGRLDSTEFKERLDRAMGAKTRGDLHGLFDDLPTLHATQPPTPHRRGRLVPFLLIMGFFVVAAGMTVNTWPFIHIPWLLIVIGALYIWHRVGGTRRIRQRHHHHHHDSIEV
jgi:hypothetical protein